MFSRTGVLALAAVATIGAAALISSTSSADARGFGGGVSRDGGVHFGGFRGNFRHAGFRYHHRPHWHRHVRWHRPWIYGAGTAAIAAPAYAAVAAKPPAGPCTCLTKEYTRENQVVFMDRCTKETAAAPLGGMQAMPQQGQPDGAEPMPTK